MAKDYKRSSRAPARRKSAPATPGPVWFLAGLALGLCAAVAVHAYHVQFAPRMASPVAAGPDTDTQTADTTADDDGRLRFEFYKLLPEMEVVVPEDEARELATDPPELPIERPETDSAPAEDRYLLQVASFQGHAKADKLKAELALLGLEASIQTVEIDGGQTWHRVRVGPYGRSEIAKVRERLEDNGIEAVLLKLNG